MTEAEGFNQRSATQFTHCSISYHQKEACLQFGFLAKLLAVVAGRSYRRCPVRRECARK